MSDNSGFILAGTGHRPPRLGLDYTDASRHKLTNFAKLQLEKFRNISLLISGGAQGWDSALAHAAFLLNMPYLIAVPFQGQESKWPANAQKVYNDMLSNAKEVVVVSPGPYVNWKFIKRDKWMVDKATHVLSLMDDKPEKSGTRTTVEYANSLNKPVFNSWNAWVQTVYPLNREVHHGQNRASGMERSAEV